MLGRVVRVALANFKTIIPMRTERKRRDPASVKPAIDYEFQPEYLRDEHYCLAHLTKRYGPAATEVAAIPPKPTHMPAINPRNAILSIGLCIL